MAQKIFISYRRQDSGANALGIGQYLEHELGRKNVFIDVDMRAGVKFPQVLEQRLAECKVMLVLIGADWLNARDHQGQRRLDDPDDWVRLEIAHALRRNITVIPVRVNGAELPARSTLPYDIQGLLDHQAASVTLAGFRNEMSGLVRDIRSISAPRPWRRIGAIGAAGVLLLLTMLGLSEDYGYSHVLERLRIILSSPAPKAETQNEIWSSSPGEWVLFAIDQQPVPYYFKPSSVKTFGDKVVYAVRFPFKASNTTAPGSTLSPGAYEDDSTVIDCKRSVSMLSERTIYNKSGEAISHYKRADPESLDLSVGEPIKPGTILSIAEHIFCDEQLRMPLTQQVETTKLSYLVPSANGDGDIFYGPTKKTADSAYQIETLFVVRLHDDHKFADLFSGQTVAGLPRVYRSLAERLQFNCADRRVQAPKIEYFDQESNLEYLAPLLSVPPVDVKDGSPFSFLLNVVCGDSVPNVAGKYEGTYSATYENGGQGEQQISIIVEQTASEVSVSFETAIRSIGNGAGKLVGTTIDSLSLQSTTPGCPGSYEASIKFTGNSASWSFTGQDCGGPMQGHGTAKRTKL
jgi:hypothetical protein